MAKALCTVTLLLGISCSFHALGMSDTDGYPSQDPFSVGTSPRKRSVYEADADNTPPAYSPSSPYLMRLIAAVEYAKKARSSCTGKSCPPLTGHAAFPRSGHSQASPSATSSSWSDESGSPLKRARSGTWRTLPTRDEDDHVEVLDPYGDDE